jgi:hypothetical protein
MFSLSYFDEHTPSHVSSEVCTFTYPLVVTCPRCGPLVLHTRTWLVVPGDTVTVNGWLSFHLPSPSLSWCVLVLPYWHLFDMLTICCHDSMVFPRYRFSWPSTKTRTFCTTIQSFLVSFCPTTCLMSDEQILRCQSWYFWTSKVSKLNTCVGPRETVRSVYLFIMNQQIET